MNSVPSAPAALANSVGINGSTAAARQGSDGRALLPAGYAADQCASTHTAGGSQLVTMLLPEASPVLVPITNTRIVRMPVVTMPVP